MRISDWSSYVCSSDLADRVAVEADLLQPFGRTRAQVMVHAALDDAEQRRVVAFVRTPRALGPAQRKLHRAIHHVHADRLAVDVHRRALVEDHHDVRLEHLPDAHAFLSSEAHTSELTQLKRN